MELVELSSLNHMTYIITTHHTIHRSVHCTLLYTVKQVYFVVKLIAIQQMPNPVSTARFAGKVSV